MVGATLSLPIRRNEKYMQTLRVKKRNEGICNISGRAVLGMAERDGPTSRYDRKSSTGRLNSITNWASA